MKGRKVLLLGILLLLPVVAFLFLQTFGRNAYKLRTYLPERVAPAPVGAQVVSADTVYHRVDDSLALVTAAGQPFNPAHELRGRVVVLSLGHAPDLSTAADRATNRGLARVQERFQTNAAVKLLVVAPAPSPNLAAQAERSGAIGGKWIFAQGPDASLTHLHSELTGGPAPAAADALTRVWLLDRARHLRGFYDPTDPREIDRLLTEVDVLLQIERNPARP